MTWGLLICALFVILGLITVIYEFHRIVSLAVVYRQYGLIEFLPVLKDDLYSALIQMVTVTLAGVVILDATLWSTRIRSSLPVYPTLGDNVLVWSFIGFIALPQINAIIRIRQQHHREDTLLFYLQKKEQEQKAIKETLKTDS